MKKKKIAILGSTGSIGVNTLNVVRKHPQLFDVVGLSARSNIKLLKAQLISSASFPTWVVLISSIVTGILSYFFASLLINKSKLNDFRYILAEMIGRKRKFVRPEPSF